jgi:hypothetical protein
LDPLNGDRSSPNVLVPILVLILVLVHSVIGLDGWQASLSARGILDFEPPNGDRSSPNTLVTFVVGVVAFIEVVVVLIIVTSVVVGVIVVVSFIGLIVHLVISFGGGGTRLIGWGVPDQYSGSWCSPNAFVVVVISTASVIGKIEFIAVVPFVFLAIVPKADIKKG